MAATCPDQACVLAGSFHTGSHPASPPPQGSRGTAGSPIYMGSPLPPESQALRGWKLHQRGIPMLGCGRSRKDFTWFHPDFVASCLSEELWGQSVCLSSHWGTKQSASEPLSSSLPPCHREHSLMSAVFPSHCFFFYLQRCIKHQPQGHSSWIGSQNFVGPHLSWSLSTIHLAFSAWT